MLKRRRLFLRAATFITAAFSQFLRKETCPLNITVVLASSSLALLVLAIALAREVRMRRALQRLLARLLAQFRGKER